MRRRYRSTKLSIRTEQPEEVNPMESVANLVDAMLVLACGLMLALIINWNVDVGSAGTTVQLEKEQEVTSLEGVRGSGEISDLENGYEELGMVYRDPETGKLYMVTEGSGPAGDGSGTTQEAGSGSEG